MLHCCFPHKSLMTMLLLSINGRPTWWTGPAKDGNLKHMGYRINEMHQDFRVLSEPLEAQHVCWSSLLPLVALNLFNHVEHFRPILTGQWLGTGEQGLSTHIRRRQIQPFLGILEAWFQDLLRLIRSRGN